VISGAPAANHRDRLAPQTEHGRAQRAILGHDLHELEARLDAQAHVHRRDVIDRAGRAFAFAFRLLLNGSLRQLHIVSNVLMIATA